MATVAYLGQGTTLERDDTLDADTYGINIGQVQSIEGPSSTSDQVDVTNHSSLGSYREFISGLKDGGELNFDMILDPNGGGFTQMNDDFENRTLMNYLITLPDQPPMTAATTLKIYAIVTGRSISIPTDDVIRASVTLKVSGQVVITVTP